MANSLGIRPRKAGLEPNLDSLLIHTSSFWSGLLELAGHVRPFHCYPAVCLPNARVLRSLGAPLAFERFSFVFLGSGRHQLGRAFAFPDRLNP
jgi:hypothetical protein